MQENSRIFGSVYASIGAGDLLALKNLHLPWKTTRTPSQWLGLTAGSPNRRCRGAGACWPFDVAYMVSSSSRAARDPVLKGREAGGKEGGRENVDRT